MRIGILTFHRSINNGAVIQCFSLVKRLEREFPNDKIEVVDYHMPIVDEKAYNTKLINVFNGNFIHKVAVVLKFPLYLGQLNKNRIKAKSFKRALTHLPLSYEYIYENSTSRLFKYINDNYDVIIAGSDAIWNYELRGFPNPYFLSDTISCLKVSYAASCYGMNYEKIPNVQQTQIRKILNSYSLISTRDNESELFLKQIGCNIQPLHVCDPTIFLRLEDLPIDQRMIEKKLCDRGFDFNRQSIGVMGNDDMCKMLRKMFANKYQLVSLYNYNKLCDVNLYDFSPFEWAYVFKYFKVTVTTYFHGTLLSLKNGVPVVCIELMTAYSKNHMTKVYDVLKRLGLENWYFKTDYTSLNINLIKEQINTLINSNIKEDILNRLKIESDTSNAFFNTLKALL